MKTYKVTIDSAKTVRWYVKGKLHREDGPAVEWANGSKEWWKNDKLHREDGPALEWAGGRKEWYIEGKQLTEAEFVARRGSRNGQVIIMDGVSYTVMVNLYKN